MRLLYAILTASICIIIILLVGAFFYIDTHKHHVYYYNIKIDGKSSATAKLDKYVTQDRVVYQSVMETPFRSIYKKCKRRLSLDKRDLRVCDYSRTKLGDRASMAVYLKRIDKNTSFLAMGHSNFAYLDRLEAGKDFIVFEEDALISYANAVARYDFKRDGAQTLGALTQSFDLLPPMRQEITIKPAGETRIKLGEKSLDAMRLDIKINDGDAGSVWINKWSRAILKAENPRISFTAELTDSPTILKPEAYALKPSGYTEEQVTFKNKKDLALSGTIAPPESNGPHPAILLVWGAGPLDREGLGMFTNIRNYLASRGFAVFSFDKRGIGQSQGKFSRINGENTIEDLRAAVDYLFERKDIDKNNVAVLGHSEGGYYAAQLASSDQRVSMCVLMAGVPVSNIYNSDLETLDYFDKKLLPKWDEGYLSAINRMSDKTGKIVREGKDWILLQAKRIYLKKARLDLENKPLDAIRKLKIPTLILQGKKDTIVLPEQARLFEDALKEGGNTNYKIASFAHLGHFFGDIVRDGVRRTHLATDEKAMETICSWLKNNLIATNNVVIEEVKK